MGLTKAFAEIDSAGLNKNGNIGDLDDLIKLFSDFP
jgi:hypothetical protein